MRRGDGKLFELALPCCRAFARREFLHVLVAEVLAEAPVPFAAYEAFVRPAVVSPPHVAQAEEVGYILGVKSKLLARVERVAVVRVGGIGNRVGVVKVIVVPLVSRAVCVACGVGVVKQQRFAVAVVPEVFVASVLIHLVVQFLHGEYHVSVERPEAELGYFVSLGLHVGHHLPERFPCLPVAHAVGNVEDEHVHSRVGKHGNVAAYHVRVGRKEVSHFGFAPVIRTYRPALAFPVQARRRVALEHFGNVAVVRRRHVIQVGVVPGNVEYAHFAFLVGLDVAGLGLRGLYAPQCVGCHPCVGVYVPRGDVCVLCLRRLAAHRAERGERNGVQFSHYFMVLRFCCSCSRVVGTVVPG